MSIKEIRTDLIARIQSGEVASLPAPALFEAELLAEVGDVLTKPTVWQLRELHRAIGEVQSASPEMTARVIELQETIRKVLNSLPYGLIAVSSRELASAASTVGIC